MFGEVMSFKWSLIRSCRTSYFQWDLIRTPTFYLSLVLRLWSENLRAYTTVLSKEFYLRMTNIKNTFWLHFLKKHFLRLTHELEFAHMIFAQVFLHYSTPYVTATFWQYKRYLMFFVLQRVQTFVHTIVCKDQRLCLRPDAKRCLPTNPGGINTTSKPRC